jgi:phage baseplate assembly protein W
MPAYRFRSDQYVSRGFKDLAISFNANPSTDDFGAVKNERAITQSVRNLILTIFGERPFQPNVGSRVKGLLFEPWDPFSKDAIKTEIKDCLGRLEPRITVQDVRIRDNSDLNEIQVELEYKITGENTTQEVTFLLEKT